MKRLTFATVLATLVGAAATFFAGGATAFAQGGDPSAKFAAVWSDTPLIAETEASTCDPDLDPFDVDFARGALLATMKMPSGKEILAGVSAESLILLETSVKGQKGGSATAAAFGLVGAKIKACNIDTHQCYFPVPDGRIVLNARLQVLSATLGGVLESCTVGADGVIDADLECTFTDEEISLLTANASANHMNVVFVDLPQGTYEIRAKFVVLSISATDATLDACAHAGSFVALGDRIVTLQDVRAVKGGVVEIP